MANRPPLPEEFTIPSSVDRWQHDPDAKRNAHIWRNEAETKSVGVFATAGAEVVNIRVFDDRLRGFDRSQTISTVPYNRPDDAKELIRARQEASAGGIRQAVEWMELTHPSEWTHPEVCEAVFDPPAGYVLDEYYLENRTAIVYYQREDAEDRCRLAGGGQPDEYTPETCPYLYVHVWRGSGDATVALAPWRGAHGPGSKHQEIEPVADPPEECGLEVAITVAREWARKTVATDTPSHSEQEHQSPRVGQTALSNWGETA
jgi:hypothetical protein